MRHILDNNPNINRVIVGFGYHNISSYYDSFYWGENSYHTLGRFVPVFTFDDFFFLMKKNPRLVVSPTVLKNIIKNLFYEKNNFPFIGEYTKRKMQMVLNKTMMLKRLHTQYYQNDISSRYSTVNLFYLDKIIKYCREKNKIISFIKSPLAENYKKRIPEDIKLMYESMIEKYDLDVIDMDSLKWTNSQFLPDGDHLNSFGRRIASKYLENILSEH